LAIFQSRLLPVGTSQLLIVFAFGMLLFALGYLWATWRGHLPLTRLSEILPAFVRDWQPLQRFHDYIISVEQQIGEFSRDKPLVLLLGLGISILSWTLVVVESWLAITFLGIQFSFIDAYIVVVVAQVAFLFPSPAGLGAVEAALVFAFPGLGYPASLGTALALLLRFQDVLVTTLGLSVGGWRFYKQDMQAKLDGDTQPAGNPVRDGKASEAGYGDDSQRNGQVRNDRLRHVYYDLTASVYDRVLSLFSDWDGVDEARERQLLASKLQISSNDRVLEIAIGTGSNIPYMFREGASNLSIIGIDFSRNMLLQCRHKLLSGAITTELVQSDAAWLPFPSNYFNAILHFGGFSNFSQQCQALEEMFRVARNGARIVIGDMSLANLRSPSIHQKILLKLRPEVSLPPPVYLLPARYIEDMSLYRFWGGAAYILKLVKP
ncbi:MAG: lysylphosphatidylglycerol synthase domain-containing protein, partial [Anaerolineales bacterium]